MSTRPISCLETRYRLTFKDLLVTVTKDQLFVQQFELAIHYSLEHERYAQSVRGQENLTVQESSLQACMYPPATRLRIIKYINSLSSQEGLEALVDDREFSKFGRFVLVESLQRPAFSPAKKRQSDSLQLESWSVVCPDIGLCPLVVTIPGAVEVIVGI